MLVITYMVGKMHKSTICIYANKMKIIKSTDEDFNKGEQR